MVAFDYNNSRPLNVGRDLGHRMGVPSSTSDSPLSDLLLNINRDILLSSGRLCRIEPALRRYIDHHYVVFFPEGQESGPPSAQEVSDMLRVTYREARRLAKLVRGDEECFSITMNGRRTGTWPDIVHCQIYLFRDREEKIRVYDAVTTKLREQLDSEA